MAKAKFPGKPPKTSQITRLRVSSNCVESANDPSRLAAQQAAFGLKLFHQHFATDEEVSSLPPFRFSWLSAMASGLVIQHYSSHVARLLRFSSTVHSLSILFCRMMMTLLVSRESMTTLKRISYPKHHSLKPRQSNAIRNITNQCWRKCCPGLPSSSLVPLQVLCAHCL